MKYTVRLAKQKSEACVKGTMVSLTSREIILKERFSFGTKNWRRLTQELMGEILSHEVVHLVLLDILDEITSTALDNICGWNSYQPLIEFDRV